MLTMIHHRYELWLHVFYLSIFLKEPVWSSVTDYGEFRQVSQISMS